ncbi:DUF2332 domain-containing protein [Nonomuraea sp. NPDC050404]|uniref:DUF2332 domain-containing protein n=1 Tax=Nonomuraea sp. NPDC050404 TaxID=3155783 RepID=UPI0033CDF347
MTLTEMDATAEQYRDFAARQARGASPLYEQLTLGVAADGELLDLLTALPPAKRQPNLLLAATRYLTGTASGYDDFRRSVLDNRDAVVATMLARYTQTNEPGRCAALYPLLASLPQPVALLEVGASAGLCLYPDRYAYDYDGRAAGAVDSPLRLSCRTEGSPPPHLAEPGPVTVAWRAGIDLNPLDVRNADDVRWLRTLVWPEQDERLRRLDTAIALAQADPPHLLRGDLNARLGELAAQAPAHATLVVFHTAVLCYVPDEERAAFVDQVGRLDCRWISQEGPEFFPGIAARLRRQPPADTITYVLAQDGRPLAFSAMHGGWIQWLP